MNDKDISFAAIAVNRDLLLNTPETIQAAVDEIKSALKSIVTEIEESGAPFMGHAKALLDGGRTDQIFFSVTRNGQEPRQKGTFNPKNIEKARLTVNVIAAGASKFMVEGIVIKALAGIGREKEKIVI